MVCGVCVELRPSTVLIIYVVVAVRVSAATDLARAVVLGKPRLVVVRDAVCATAYGHPGCRRLLHLVSGSNSMQGDSVANANNFQEERTDAIEKIGT